jgi:hypothetical protein
MNDKSMEQGLFRHRIQQEGVGEKERVKGE